MKEFNYVLMSEDVYPDGSNAEDPHQKYAGSIMAKDEDDASKKIIENYEREGKPVYWIRFIYN